MDLNSRSGDILYSVPAKNLREAIQVLERENTRYLACADFSSKDLRRVDFSRFNLSGANFSGALLEDANFSYSLLEYADFSGADILHANFSAARLFKANLSDTHAAHAIFTHADLRSVNLKRAILPAPTAMLLAAWGSVGAQLTADLMEWDCWNHGDRDAFNRYGQDSSECPYREHLESRAAQFQENAYIWSMGVGKLCTPSDLLARLFKEKDILR